MVETKQDVVAGLQHWGQLHFELIVEYRVLAVIAYTPNIFETQTFARMFAIDSLSIF